MFNFFRSKIISWVFIISLIKIIIMKKILFIILIFSLGCSKEKSIKVKYSIMCDCHGQGLDIVYVNEAGNTISEKITYDIWEKEFIAKKGDYVSVLGQANALNSKIAARVYSNGNVIKEETIAGDYAIAVVGVNLPK